MENTLSSKKIFSNSDCIDWLVYLMPSRQPIASFERPVCIKRLMLAVRENDRNICSGNEGPDCASLIDIDVFSRVLFKSTIVPIAINMPKNPAKALHITRCFTVYPIKQLLLMLT